MTGSSTTSLSERWRDGATTLGGWLSMPGSVTAEIVARSGVDYVCIDCQHGAIDHPDVVGMIQAVGLGPASPIVRVPGNEPWIIGRMLDAGAHGIIVPLVNSPEEATAAVRACRYPPEGERSYGPTLAGMRTGGGNHVAWARANVAVIPMIETPDALDRVDEIVAVDGVDAIYVGPSDLSLGLGLPPGNHDDVAVFADALTRIVEACDRAGVVAGIHSNGRLAPARVAAGFRMVTVATDAVAIRSGVALELERARSGIDDQGGGGGG